MVPHGWDGIQSVLLKGTHTIALPLYMKEEA